MKLLKLEDLSRQELLAWIKLAGFLFLRQSDLLAVRHETLAKKCEALSSKWADASIAEAKALTSWLAYKGDGRERNRLDRIYLDLKDAATKARRASDRAERERETCWKALEAEWERAR